MKADDVKLINGVLEAASDIVCTTSNRMRDALDAYRAAGSPRVPELPSKEALDAAVNIMDGEVRECMMEKQTELAAGDEEVAGFVHERAVRAQAVAAFLRALKGEP